MTRGARALPLAAAPGDVMLWRTRAPLSQFPVRRAPVGVVLVAELTDQTGAMAPGPP